MSERIPRKDPTKKEKGFLHALRRLTASHDELESEDLQRSARESGATAVSECADRQRVVLRGTINTVTLKPAGNTHRSLEVDFHDGSGSVTLIWMGRREIPGIRAGTTIRVEGRISCHGDGRRMYNPRYELLDVPSSS